MKVSRNTGGFETTNFVECKCRRRIYNCSIAVQWTNATKKILWMWSARIKHRLSYLLRFHMDERGRLRIISCFSRGFLTRRTEFHPIYRHLERSQEKSSQRLRFQRIKRFRDKDFVRKKYRRWMLKFATAFLENDK